MGQEKVEWSDNYLIGIVEIDIQHKKLVEIANVLYDIACGPEKIYRARIEQVFKALLDYTVYHFSAEEKIMAKYGYPSLATHKASHDAFVRYVNMQAQKLNIENQKDGLELYRFVSNWVITHIAKADMLWARIVKRILAK